MRIIYSLFVIVQCAISALAQTGQFTDLTATRSLRVPIYADTPSFGSRGWVISTHDGRVWLRNFNNTSWLDITGTGVGAGL
ncbi:MAG TPA: hypothetical protein PKD90_04435, partial [Phnomibacter sp.]|nr:hypothetical protein [Phnomibacter sp.]